MGVTTCTETEYTNEAMTMSACVHCRESIKEESSIQIKVEEKLHIKIKSTDHLIIYDPRSSIILHLNTGVLCK